MCSSSPSDEALERYFAIDFTDSYLWAQIFRLHENIDARGFTVIHNIVLGFAALSLELELTRTTSLIDAIDTSGRTALCWACIKDEHQAVRLLVKHGANPFTYDSSGFTPLHYAVLQGNLESTKLLIEHFRTRIHTGKQDGSTETYLEAKELVSGFTPLHRATKTGHTHIVMYLIDEGANINAVASAGNPVALVAVFHNRRGPLELLLNLGASTYNSQSSQTILHCAAIHANGETIKFLINHNLKGVDVLARDSEGDTAWECFLFRRVDGTPDGALKKVFKCLIKSIVADGKDCARAAYLPWEDDDKTTDSEDREDGDPRTTDSYEEKKRVGIEIEVIETREDATYDISANTGEEEEEVFFDFTDDECVPSVVSA